MSVLISVVAIKAGLETGFDGLGFSFPTLWSWSWSVMREGLIQYIVTCNMSNNSIVVITLLQFIEIMYAVVNGNLFGPKG